MFWTEIVVSVFEPPATLLRFFLDKYLLEWSPTKLLVNLVALLFFYKDSCAIKSSSKIDMP